MAPTSGGTTTSVAEVPNPPLLIPPPPFSWAAVVSGQVAGAPISPRSFSKSFHDVLEQNGPIKQKIPSTFRGEPSLFFSKEEITKLATPFRYTVIGKFCYHRPSMEIIRKFFTSLGLKSLQSVGLLQQNHIAIFISQKEYYTRLLMRATWYISGAPMKVLKWSPEFYPNIESPVVPVWVGLPGLPLHFFEKSALFCIASVLGNPLKIDEPTAKLSRPTVARVCIEVDVSKPRNRRIWLGDEKDGFWQEVIFENPPQYCGFCKVLAMMYQPVVMVETDKKKEMWRRKEADTETDKPKDADGWVVVGEKKKNKIHSSTSKEETEKAMVAGKIKCTHSEISAKLQEEVQLPEESGEKTEGATAKQTTTFLGPPVLMVKSKMVAKSLISKNFPTGAKEKEGTVTEERSIQKNFAS